MLDKALQDGEPLLLLFDDGEEPVNTIARHQLVQFRSRAGEKKPFIRHVSAHQTTYRRMTCQRTLSLLSTAEVAIAVGYRARCLCAR